MLQPPRRPCQMTAGRGHVRRAAGWPLPVPRRSPECPRPLNLVELIDGAEAHCNFAMTRERAVASAPRARGRSTGAEGVCERRPFLLMKATSMLFSIPDMLTPSAAWLVGAGTLLLHAQLKKRRNRVSSGQSTASSQAKLAKTIGSGRRSRFQDSQIPPLFCVPDARAYESATEKINLSVETSTVLEVGCQLNRVTHSLAARQKP